MSVHIVFSALAGMWLQAGWFLFIASILGMSLFVELYCEDF